MIYTYMYITYKFWGNRVFGIEYGCILTSGPQKSWYELATVNASEKAPQTYFISISVHYIGLQAVYISFSFIIRNYLACFRKIYKAQNFLLKMKVLLFLVVYLRWNLKWPVYVLSRKLFATFNYTSFMLKSAPGTIYIEFSPLK